MDFASSSDVGSSDVSATETKRDSKTIDARAFNVVTDPSRDARRSQVMSTPGAGQIYRWLEEAVPSAGSQRSLDSQDTTLSRRGLLIRADKRARELAGLKVGAGDVVACPDRGLDGTGSAPGGQQREVQVDPPMGRHIQDRPRQQRPVGDDGGGVRSQRSEFVRELRRPGRSGCQYREACLGGQLGDR